MLDEVTVFQAIYDYAILEYGDRLKILFEEYKGRFPERDSGLPPELWFKDFLSYLMYEVPFLDGGRTIAEDFTDSYKDMDIEMARTIHGFRKVIRSDFVVISKDGETAVIKDRNTDVMYKIRRDEEGFPLRPNMLINGRIIPFGDHYRFTGIMKVFQTPLIMDPDIYIHAYQERMMNKMENLPLKGNTTFSSIMNKYPSTWIDFMCKHFRVKERLKRDKIYSIERKIMDGMEPIVKGLSEDAKKVLGICIDNGGYVKTGALKDYDDDTTYFWEGNSNTPIGSLRKCGLLIIGRMNMGGRNYKVALVPVEFREDIEKALLLPVYENNGSQEGTSGKGRSTLDKY